MIAAAVMNRTADAAQDSEAGLVLAAQRGDQAAFGALVRRHQRRVFRLVGRFYRHPEDVDDLAQETFLLAWRKLGSYRRDAPFEHWLTRLCLNQCYQELRKRRPREVDLEAVRDTPAPCQGDPTAALDAARLLAQLPPKDRFLLLLLDGEGWSTEEIAERLGWSRSNVKVRAHRARKALRRRVEEEMEP
ncbi:MAG: RNA polymerase sigma factor [Acidobacteria bacterium]|nr:RNA polymerase sigma factor [Acidobacteriota bacterium]